MIEASSQYLDPTTKTNVNEIDPLFENSIEDYKGFEQSIENQASSSVEGMREGGGFDSVPFHEGAEQEAKNLSNIKAQDLEHRGREEFAKNPEINDIFIDHTKPGVMEHKRDAEDIANATGTLLKNLVAKLKNLGVDCKTVKGNKEIEPEYHIELNSRSEQNRIYDKFFCEQLRNQYACVDSLTLTCRKKGMKWEEWEHKQIRVAGGELVRFDRGVLTHNKRDKKVFEWNLYLGAGNGHSFFKKKRSNNPYTVSAIREFLSTKHEGATIDNISTEMSAYWDGGLFSINGWRYGGRTLGSKDYAWSTYVINYQYRTGKLVCEEWDEQWDERCRLN
jgi:hypothetical protein